MMSPTCFFLFFFQRAGCFLVVLCCVVFSVTAAAAAETMVVGIGLFGEWLGWALSSRVGPASSYTRSHDGVSSIAPVNERKTSQFFDAMASKKGERRKERSADNSHRGNI